MADYTLILGNRARSSWSLRAWLAMRQTGLAFDTIWVDLRNLAGRFELARHSPTRHVPVLRHGGLTIWDSLAIVEYLAEQAPDARLWPETSLARAVARCVAAEMHAGFAALCRHMPMNIGATDAGPPDFGSGEGKEVKADIARIVSLWRDTRERFGADGPFLFGEWTAADAFFAPVVCRFETYGVRLDNDARAYCDAVLAWRALADWVADAQAVLTAPPNPSLIPQQSLS